VWGIFDDSFDPVFNADTYLEVSVKAKTKVSQFPVERGGFVDYNKVQDPIDIKARFAVGGDMLQITLILVKLELEKNSTNLYRVVTPGRTYSNMTLVSFDYKRTQDKGHNMIVADLDLTEIRQVDPAYASVKIPPTKAKDPNTPEKKTTGQAQAESENDSHWAIAKGIGYGDIFSTARELTARPK
jgi:hypothetical protein